MNLITQLSAQPWVGRLGWTLLHFLWLGTLIAVVYAAARRAARSASPNARYLLACLALAVIVATPVATWILLRPSVSTLAVAPPAAIPSSPVALQGHTAIRVNSDYTLPQPVLSWVVAVWFAGTIAFWIRLAGGWALTIRLRSVSVRPAPSRWQNVFDRLKAAVRVSPRVRLLVSSVVTGPMVVGWIRPVVLVPMGALAGLPPEQVEAILLHELAHVRRGDYLVNILQSVVEALLFYHPAVWWISNHIREERESCCDDLAVSITGDVTGYALALAELASFRPTPVAAAVAATGGSLSRRIARLLGQPRPDSLRIAGPGVLTTLALVAVTAFAMFAQSTAPPKFEVASVKPSSEQRFMTVHPLPGGRLTATAPLRLLIQNAYGLQAFQIIGGPRWIDLDRYEIEAKAEGNANRAEVFQMLQTLLKDRFQLKTHSETRELPVYLLVAAKNGPKLSPPKDGGCVATNPDGPPPPPRTGFPCGRAGIMVEPGGARIAGAKVLMPEFTRILSIVMGRSVIDKTGVSTQFDAQVDFAPDATTAGLPVPINPGGPGGASPPAEPASPSIFSAIQEQLGLKLESGKGPVEVLVIDHVERPSGN